MPEHPWRGRVRLIPEAYPARFGGTFRREVGRLIRVLLVHPSHAAFDLLQIGILAVDPDFSHLPLIFVGVEHLDADLLPIDQIGEGLLGSLAEVLLLLGCIDLVEPNLGQALVAVEDCQGIAIGHTDHATREGFRVGMGRKSQDEWGDELHELESSKMLRKPR